MRILLLVLTLFVAACAPAPNETQQSPPSEYALDRALIIGQTGNGSDWQAEAADVKRAFALAAVTGLGFGADREERAATLSTCIDLRAGADPEVPIAQLAADCVNAHLRPARTQPTQTTQITEAEFDACRPEVNRLIYGRVSDWRIAAPECRVAYAMVSAESVGARGSSDVRALLSCISRLTESSPGHEYLADLSRHCAHAL